MFEFELCATVYIRHHYAYMAAACTFQPRSNTASWLVTLKIASAVARDTSVRPTLKMTFTLKQVQLLGWSSKTQHREVSVSSDVPVQTKSARSGRKIKQNTKYAD